MASLTEIIGTGGTDTYIGVSVGLTITSSNIVEGGVEFLVEAVLITLDTLRWAG